MDWVCYPTTLHEQQAAVSRLDEALWKNVKELEHDG